MGENVFVWDSRSDENTTALKRLTFVIDWVNSVENYIVQLGYRAFDAAECIVFRFHLYAAVVGTVQ